MQETVRPFLGLLDGFDEIAANTVVAIPRGIERGAPQWPGCFWRYAFVSDLTPLAWLPFTQGRLTRLLHFGVRVDYAAARHVLIVHPADPKLARAGHIDGALRPWASDRREEIAIHPRLHRAIDAAVRAFVRDPLPR
jgi:hypothetical protein